MGTIIILVGLPGTGKSSWIKENKNKYIRLSIDIVRENLYGKSKSIENVRTSKLYLLDIIKQSLEYGQDIVIDDYNLTKRERKEILDILPIETYKKAVYFKPNMDKIIERFKDSHDLSEKVLRKMYKDTEEISSEEGFDEVIIV